MNKFFCDPEIPEETSNAVNMTVSRGRLPQSILLTGGSEKLREKCVKELCRAAMCLNITKDSPFPCGKCNACVKIKSGIHPDITTLLPPEGKKTVTIDSVRKQIIATLCEAPNEAGNKVYILPEADTLSVTVQNALLKTIEEPPEYALFILTANQRETLLTTIISRVTEYPLGDTLTSKSRKTDENVQQITSDIIKALTGDNEYGLFMSTAPMQKNRKLISSVAGTLITAVRDALCEESGAELLSGLDDGVFMLATSFTAASLLKIKQEMDIIVSDAAANANENLLITRFCSKLAVIQKERQA